VAGKVPRGILNCNPGNIRHGEPWYGLAPAQLDPDFCTFTHAKFGIRAMAKILMRYRAIGVRSIREIIERWAPPNENDTQAYIADVLKRCGLADADAEIDAVDYYIARPLIEAIIWHENGIQPYDDATLRAGLELAGASHLPLWPVVPRKQPEPEPPADEPSVWGFVKSLFRRG
jgi:hypothetical protein